MPKAFSVILLLTALAWQPLDAQQLEPNGEFLTDTIRIGEEFGYTLSVIYPAELDIVFPDSTFKYGVFDLERKEPFPTVTKEGQSRDSAVYWFTSFEIDSLQYLELPIFQVDGEDSIAHYPGEDFVVLEHVVTDIPDSVAMIDNTIYKKVNYQFNYPYFIIGTGILLIIIILVIVFFGRRIRNRYRSFVVTRRHRKFLEAFNDMAGQEDAEPVLSYWKRYMEKLEKIPYTRMTTREIVSENNFKQLEKPLKSIDRAIYGNRIDPQLNVTWADLREFSNQRYLETINQLKHG